MITASIVKELRDKTNAGMMDCKKVLTETNGDLEAAIKLLKTLVSDTQSANYCSAKALRQRLGFPASLYGPLLKTLKQAELVIEKDDIILPTSCEISLYDVLCAFIGQIPADEIKSLSSEADRLKQIGIDELSDD